MSTKLKKDPLHSFINGEMQLRQNFRPEDVSECSSKSLVVVDEPSNMLVVHGQKRQYNYTFLERKQAYVPEKYLDHFQIIYANSLHNGFSNGICEVIPKADLRRFAIDLDLRVPKDFEFDVAHIKIVCQLVQVAVECFYPSREVVLHVARAKDKVKKDVRGVGLHFFAEGIVVSLEQEQQITMGIQQFLEVQLGDGEALFGVKFLEPWSQMVDGLSAGLRMIGAVKFSKCKQCCGTLSAAGSCPDERCSRGLINEGRPYTYWRSFGPSSADHFQLENPRCESEDQGPSAASAGASTAAHVVRPRRRRIDEDYYTRDFCNRSAASLFWQVFMLTMRVRKDLVISMPKECDALQYENQRVKYFHVAAKQLLYTPLVLPNWCELHVAPSKSLVVSRPSTTTSPSTIMYFDSKHEKDVFGSCQMETLAAGDPRLAYIVEQFSNLVSTEHASMRVHSVCISYKRIRGSRSAGGGGSSPAQADRLVSCYVIKARGANCRFCYNKGQPHSSNSVYFQLSSTRGQRGTHMRLAFCMQQRCFSKKKPDGAAVACSSFYSNAPGQCVTLSDEGVRVLFPGVAESVISKRMHAQQANRSKRRNTRAKSSSSSGCASSTSSSSSSLQKTKLQIVKGGGGGSAARGAGGDAALSSADGSGGSGTGLLFAQSLSQSASGSNDASMFDAAGSPSCSSASSSSFSSVPAHQRVPSSMKLKPPAEKKELGLDEPVLGRQNSAGERLMRIASSANFRASLSLYPGGSSGSRQPKGTASLLSEACILQRYPIKRSKSDYSSYSIIGKARPKYFTSKKGVARSAKQRRGHHINKWAKQQARKRRDALSQRPDFAAKARLVHEASQQMRKGPLTGSVQNLQKVVQLSKSAECGTWQFI